jgi:sterol desaturase/sphingolipid hydroxylase (fatty acid hydroxylase superfamily)
MIERMGHRATAPRGHTGLANWTVTSATNYQVAMASDLFAAVAFLAFGFHRFVGPLSLAGGVVLLGFLSFGLLEYAVHRWILHGPRSIARRGHAHHHAEPTALIATPLFIVMIASLAIWKLLGLVCPAGCAAFLVFGLYAGYDYFALFHHWEHHHRPDVACGAYWRRLDRLHHVHHQRQSVNFGVSTTIWDHVFGTFQPAIEVRNNVALERHCIGEPTHRRAGR